MVMRTTNFAESIDEPIRETYFLAFDELPEQYPEWANVDEIGRNFEDDLLVAELGSVPQKTEGTATTFDDAVEIATKRYQPLSFGLGFRVTNEMWNDDRQDIMRNMTEALAFSTRQLSDVQAALILDNATSSAGRFAGARGEALLSATHATESAGTWANRPATATDLSYTAVQSGIISMRTAPTERGHKVRYTATMALVQVNDQFVAWEIFKQNAKPNSSDRDNNTVSGNPGNLSNVIVSDFQSDLDQWSLLARKGGSARSGHSLWVVWRQRPVFSTGDDFDSGDVKVKVFARLDVGHTDPHGFYGSVGA